MNVKQMVEAVRDNSRDFSGTIFAKSTIIRYINECIDRIGQVLYELGELPYLEADEQAPDFLPKRYHSLIVAYATGRCFTQDGDHAQGVAYMNEFEVKIEELRYAVDAGDVVLSNEYGDLRHSRNEYVNHYYNSPNTPSHNSPYTEEV